MTSSSRAGRLLTTSSKTLTRFGASRIDEDAGGTDDDGFEFDSDSDFEGPAPTKPKEKAAPRLVRAADLLKRPDAKWRIEGVLPETGTAMIIGPPGSGKSFLGLDMARAIASGADWCG